jgi:hypothetical protein
MKHVAGPFLAAAAILAAAPASAHPGDHSRFSFTDLAAHVFEVDHLVFLALIVIVGLLAYRAGRRSAGKRSAP